jgi:hypothetical protein
MAALEADGKIYRTGKMRNGQPVFAATPQSRIRRGYRERLRSNCH